MQGCKSTHGSFLLCLSLKFSMNKEARAKFSWGKWMRLGKVRPGAEPRGRTQGVWPPLPKKNTKNGNPGLIVQPCLCSGSSSAKECVAYILAQAPASPPTPVLTVSAAELRRPRCKHNKCRKHPEHMALIYRYFLWVGGMG